jgi:hypothetical protein
MKRHVCEGCHVRYTTKPRCAPCATRDKRKAAELNARKRKPGTLANLGVEAWLRSIVAPAGLTGTVRPPTPDERYNVTGEDVALVYEAASKDRDIAILVVPSSEDDTYFAATGHTYFTTPQGRFSFDARGVSDSFYIEPEDTHLAVEYELAKQVEKVAEVRTRHATSVEVPGLPTGRWLVTPEQRAEISATLQGGGTHSFTPAGFGVGYQISAKRSRLNNWAQPGSAALAAFFSVPNIFVMSLDCD